MPGPLSTCCQVSMSERQSPVHPAIGWVRIVIVGSERHRTYPVKLPWPVHRAAVADVHWMGLLVTIYYLLAEELGLARLSTLISFMTLADFSASAGLTSFHGVMALRQWVRAPRFEGESCPKCHTCNIFPLLSSTIVTFPGAMERMNGFSCLSLLMTIGVQYPSFLGWCTNVSYCRTAHY